MKNTPAAHAPPAFGLLLLAASAVLSSCDRKQQAAAVPAIPWNDSIQFGSVTDARDSQVYKTVAIGKATWMAQNLNFAGPAGKKMGAWYKENADSGAKYGRLYTWAEAMGIPESGNTKLWGGSSVQHQGICPEGWHVPSDSEWTTLTNTALAPANAGEELKSKVGWIPDGGGTGNGTDLVGFRALPGGDGDEHGHGDKNTFGVAGVNAAFWTSSENFSDYAWFRIIYNGSGTVNRFSSSKSYGFSLRCLKG
jgi:uncharacterized protein (TIGR02145 family)